MSNWIYISAYTKEAIGILEDRGLDWDSREWFNSKQFIITKRNGKHVDGERYDLLIGRSGVIVGYRKNRGWYSIQLDALFNPGKIGDFLGNSLPSRFGFNPKVIEYVQSKK